MKISRVSIAASTAGVLAFTLAGCVANNPSANNQSEKANPSALSVAISDDTCVVSAATAPSGVTTFTLTNNGTVRNEFEILADDKLRIVGERENLGPGTTVEYTIALEPGTYYTACKKNMVGALVGTAQFTVTDSGTKAEVSADEQSMIDSAVTNYTAYIRDQAGQLLAETQKFAEIYISGATEAAKAAYAPTRMYYERIEPTAEAFGDIDPALDLREADFQEGESGMDEWTGWHLIEKDLWRPEGYEGLSEEQRKDTAGKLVENTQHLYDLVYSAEFSVSLDDISNGAIALLEEVATSKITGEEEAFSHTDLWDFVANVEGAKVAYGNVETLAKQKDPELAKRIHEAFEGMQAELGKYVEGDGYASYDTVDDAGRKALSDKVNALRLPLAQLTAAIIK
ncbi:MULTISPECIES: iron uptake system protein EfeO [unclassified Schaalia]|uniref:iron uptake system protein EfeO n=1 Tax=unclassified Schaalia TaxID=2691889 RepID=UPI001E40CDE8|nr:MULTISPECIES: iron uptake system protein EfeO [unclassified Schaalia]MCD4549794.1 cupredoxin domain-containing protein [Schaalia sp. lx-260]MCD4556810.1 cupredoxin domain-containing protein [Schaalia sp. lx-100]